MEKENKKNGIVPRISNKMRGFKEIKISPKFKKNLIVTLSIALIGGAVLLNWAFFSEPRLDSGSVIEDGENAANSEIEDDYFEATQISRQRARDESMQVLQTIVDNEEALDDVKSEAWADITKIAENIEAEANIESLVMSKGIAECVAVVSDDSATVIVKTDGLMENQITQIQEIVFEQAGIAVENLKIIEK